MSAANRSRLLIHGITAVYWLLAFILTHLPPAEVPKTRMGDKFAHFMVYALLGSLLYLSLWTTRRSTGALASLVLVIGCIYGAVDELTQPLVGRMCSLNDWLANAAGTVTAVALFSFVRLISSPRHD